MVWKGLHCIDATILEKCTAPEALAAIRRLQGVYSVPDSRVVFDGISIGEFIGGAYGMITGAVSFKAGNKPIGRTKHNYQTLKAQCADKAATLIKQGLLTISPQVYSNQYKSQHIKAFRTFKEVLADDIRALRFEALPNGKMKLIPKKDQKEILNGRSPDILDNLIYIAYFYLDYTDEGWMSDDANTVVENGLVDDSDDLLDFLSGDFDLF